MRSVHIGRRPVRVLAAGLVGLVAAAAVAVPAQAHLPVVLSSGDTVVGFADSPYVPDGTVSFAFYGWLDRPGDTRVARIHLDAGQQFNAQLLIPDLSGENTIPGWQLPRLAVIDPSGRPQLLRDDERVSFHEPFTNTDYLNLAETVSPARTGTYALIVVGASPARFVAVSGSNEQFTAAIEHAHIGTVADVQYWYRTPAGTETAPAAG
jgi:hypothetical protein